MQLAASSVAKGFSKAVSALPLRAYGLAAIGAAFLVPALLTDAWWALLLAMAASWAMP
jgi:hypothetical protein